MVRINLRLPIFNKKSKVTIMGTGLGYSSTIFTRIDSISSNIDFPTIVKSYYRPQLQRNPFVDDSFLIASMDDKDPKFNKLNESIILQPIECKAGGINTVNIICNKSRHSSITFASIFNQNQTMNNSMNLNEHNNSHNYEKNFDCSDKRFLIKHYFVLSPKKMHEIFYFELF